MVVHVVEQPLPSIEVEPSFQDVAKTANPAKIAESFVMQMSS